MNDLSLSKLLDFEVIDLSDLSDLSELASVEHDGCGRNNGNCDHGCGCGGSRGNCGAVLG